MIANLLREYRRKACGQMPDAPASAPPALARPIANCPMITLIGRDMAVDCGLSTVGAVIVSGRVSGDVEASWIEVDARARVDGDIQADHAVIHGEVTGSVRAQNIALGPAARIGGDALAERLHVSAEAQVGGRSMPSIRLTPRLLRELRRIARNPHADRRADPATLAILRGEGLIFERADQVFVSIYGHLELSRHWKRSIGMGPSHTARLCLAAARPPQVAAARRSLARAGAELSVIGDDVQLYSDLATGGHLHVHGNVYGDVRAESCVTGDASCIAGSVRARRVSIAGHVSGEVTGEQVLLLTTAQVDGEVNFGAIEARGGARYASGRQVSGVPVTRPVEIAASLAVPVAA